MNSPTPIPPPAEAVTHYENFPVASWLCPAPLRAPIAAIYHFARTADDLADEGDASTAQRLADLAAYRADLYAIAQGQAPTPRWAQVFAALAHHIQTHRLPVPLLNDLLTAFERDIHHTAAEATYQSWDEVLDYCRYSANPVGRLLLHLYGVDAADALAQSDAICTALQLINFWQDLSVDITRGRYYLPIHICAAHGIYMQTDESASHFFSQLHQHPAAADVIAACTSHARQTMRQGAALVHRIPGRAGWELRGVVQGALCVLDKVERLGANVLMQRPRLHRYDLPAIVWRMLWMR